jgi:hypothetical protein
VEILKFLAPKISNTQHLKTQAFIHACYKESTKMLNYIINDVSEAVILPYEMYLFTYRLFDINAILFHYAMLYDSHNLAKIVELADHRHEFISSSYPSAGRQLNAIKEGWEQFRPRIRMGWRDVSFKFIIF